MEKKIEIFEHYQFDTEGNVIKKWYSTEYDPENSCLVGVSDTSLENWIEWEREILSLSD